MSRLFLVRHGETVWHAENRYAGRSDVPLTPYGLAQARALAHWAADARLTAVWSSPLSRARLTAEPAAQATGLTLRIDDRLLELSFGEAEGLTAAEMAERFPAERVAFEQDPVRHWLPGGEDPSLAADRGVAALYSIAADPIATDNPDHSRSLVVAHSTLFRLALCRLLGIDLARYRTLFPTLLNSALTEIELTPSGITLHSLNVPLNLPLNLPLPSQAPQQKG